MTINEGMVSASMPIQLEKGEQVVWDKMLWTITQIVGLEQVQIRRVADGLRSVRIVNISELEPVPQNKPLQQTKPDYHLDDIPEEAFVFAKQRKHIIQPLIDNIYGKTSETKKRAQEANFSLATAYRWFNQWKTTEKLTALIDSPRPGGRGKGRVDEKVEKVMDDFIEEFYKKKPALALKKVYRRLQEHCYANELSTPAFETLRLRVKWQQQGEIAVKREPKAKADRYRVRSENTLSAEYPRHIVQIDHAVCDVILVHEVTRDPICRPWLTVAIDVYSRMILGIYVSLEAPSATSVGACIAHAILPKDDYLARVAPEVKWPSWGEISILHSDNGADFRCERLSKAMTEYGIERHFRPVTKPWYGGYIESYIGKLSDEMSILPGNTDNKLTSNEYNPETAARYDFAAFETWLVEQIGQYHRREHTQTGETPLARYERGLLVGDENLLARGLPTMRTDAMRVRVDFLPEVLRTIRPDGVLNGSRKYWGDVLNVWVGYRDPNNPNQNPKFRFKENDQDVTELYFFEPNIKSWYLLTPSDLSAGRASRGEYKAGQRAVKKNGRDPRDQREVFASIARMRLLDEQQVALTMKARQDAKSAKGMAPKTSKSSNKQDQKHRNAVKQKCRGPATPKPTTKPPAESSMFDGIDLDSIKGLDGGFK